MSVTKITQLFNNLNTQERLELIESLSLQPDIINYVAKLMTECLRGHGIGMVSPEIQEAITEIAMQAHEIKANEFRDLNLKLTTALNSNIALRAEVKDLTNQPFSSNYQRFDQ